MSAIIPLQAIPAQQIYVNLNQQNCTLNVYQKTYGVFMDVISDNELVVAGVACQNINRIIRNAYFGFDGDFIWYDSQGSTDPIYTGIGERYFLIYLEPSEIAA